MREIVFPKTNLTDYVNFNKEKHDLINNLAKESITLEQAKITYEKIQEKYENKIFTDDQYLFDGPLEYINFLKENNLPTDDVLHEVQHVRKAKELGYQGKYGCAILLDNNKPVFLPYFQFSNEPKNIKDGDLEKIIGAPDNLSDLDKELLEK